MKPFLRAAFMALFSASAALAQDVTLTSRDGAIELSGSLMGFDGEFYRIDSEYGPLTVSADGVDCTGPGCPDLTAFVAETRFVGAPAISQTLMPEIIEAFALTRGLELSQRIEADGATTFTLSREDGQPAARFHLRPSTSADAFLALFNGDADVALTLREPLNLEQRAADALGEGNSLARRARIIGLDALVAVTARSNPVDRISREALAAVFSGTITNWSELGGPDAPIALHLPDAATGLSQAFSEEVLAGGGLAPLITRHEDPRRLSDTVARDPFAIGITALSQVGNARDLALSGPCGFAVSATPQTLKSEDYPLTAPLFLFTPRFRLPRITREFIEFFEAASAERVVRRAGFVSQAITQTPLDDQGMRLVNALLAAGDEILLADLQRMAERLSGAIRLSPTVRFADGSSNFDTQSLSAISRLARAIEQGDFDGRTLVFAGFSDGAGRAEANLNLSRSRADAVRRAVIEAAGAADLDRVTFRSVGFGEAMPIACDNSDWGAALNRRVEIWLE